MKKFLYLAIGISIINGGCKDDEPRAEVFTLQVQEDYIPDHLDMWVIISDSDGELLDFNVLTPGVLHLDANQTSIDNTLNISFLSKRNNFGAPTSVNTFEMITYTGVDVGDTWFLRGPQAIELNQAGNANLQVTNLPSAAGVELIISSFLVGRVDYEGGITDSGTNFEANLVVPIPELPRDLLVSVSPQFLDGAMPPTFTPKYYSIGNLVDGQQINLDYQRDFIPFDNEITIEPSNNSFSGFLSIRGVQDLNIQSEGVIFTSSSFIHQLDTLEGFFNSGLNYYETNLHFNTINGSTHYHKVGDPPTTEDLAPRDLNFEMLRTSFFDYSIHSASPEFQMIESGWGNQLQTGDIFSSLIWTIFSDINETHYPVLTSFPGELVSEYPVFNIDNLENFQNRCIYNIDGRSYEDYLNSIFKQPSSLKQLEEVYNLNKFNN